MNKKNIFLYGVPGVGKTYVSKLLQEQTGYDLIELDAVREEAIKASSNTENLFAISSGTTYAYKEFGELTKENAVKGLIRSREVMLPFIKEHLGGHKTSYIAEGAFLDPLYAKENGLVILVAQKDINIHKKQFLAHREETDEMLERFNAARMIQEYIQKEAGELGIGIFESNNAADVSTLIKSI